MENEENIQTHPLVLTVQQVADLLQKKPRTVREMCYKKLIPHYKVGRSIRFREEEILAWLKQQCRIELGGATDQAHQDGE